MNLDQRIREARSALTELTADEVELSRLEAEQTGQIQALKASGSRDFAALAELEGKRAALASMIAEQRQAIGQIQAELAELEGQKVRNTALDSISQKSKRIQALKTELDAGLLALADQVTPELQRLIQLRSDWHALRNAALAEVGDAGGLTEPDTYSGRRAVTDTIQQEIREAGGNVDALLMTLHGWFPEYRGTKTVEVALPAGQVDGYSREPFEVQTRALIGDLYWQALRAHERAQGGRK